MGAPVHEQVIVVTGATSGIGRATALALGRMGARVVLCGRDEERARVVLDLLRAGGNDRCVKVLADLTTAAGVQAVADTVRRRLGRLDVLIHNAGAWFADRRVTEEGHEATWSLNHLAPYRLTHALMDRLQADGGGRVVTVASDAHRGGRIHWDDPNLASWPAMGWPAYQQSKWANIAFTVELARRLEGSGVTANALHPGFVATRIGHQNGFGARAMLTLTRPLQISPERGARTVVWAATSSDVGGLSGEYFKRRRVARPDAGTRDPVEGKRLWELSAQQVGVSPDWP